MSIGIEVVALCLLAFGGALGLTRWLLSARSPMVAVDTPGERSLHSVPTATGGGVAIMVPVLVSGSLLAVISPVSGLAWMGLSAGLVAVVSLIDDLNPLSARVRLVAHVLAAAGLALAGLIPRAIELPGVAWMLPAWLGAIFCLLYVVWMVNLYNFMDGMDGFAGGMSVIGFSTLAILGADNPTFLGLGLVIASASAGFLIFNYPPARIFMGDVGASSLGLVAAAMILWADRDGLFPFWVGVLVFSPFVVDASVTLLSRVARRDPVWKAHRSHFYQRLVRIGWSHQETVLWEYLLMFMCSVSAIVALKLTAVGQWTLLCGWTLAYTLLMVVIHRLDTFERSEL